jgi:hypothetical protein
MQKPSSLTTHAQAQTTSEPFEDTPAPEQNGKHFNFRRNFARSGAESAPADVVPVPSRFVSPPEIFADWSEGQKI